jgi:hypothetical protein
VEIRHGDTFELSGIGVARQQKITGEVASQGGCGAEVKSEALRTVELAKGLVGWQKALCLKLQSIKVSACFNSCWCW